MTGELRLDMPAADYHAAEALSASGAKKLLRSPAHYRLARTQQSEPTDAMRFGTAVHTLVLEPHRSDEIVVMPAFNSRSAAGKSERDEWLARHAGCQAFDAATYDRVRRCADAVLAHPAAVELLAGRREVSLFWRDGHLDVPCKSRFDALREDGGIGDLKTTRNASPDGFRREIGAYQYHLQAAFYWLAHESVLDRSPPFFAFVAVENDAPFGVGCYVLQSDAIRAGMRLVNQAMARYRQCLDAGAWPGYDELVQPISAPRWALTFDNY